MLRILFVEDDDDAVGLWSKRLRDDGYDVTFVVNGADALHQAGRKPFDCVLMDIALESGMRGIEAAARLRLLRPHLPLIFMSGHGDSQTLEEAKLALPAGYLIKPFTYADLIAAIERGTKHHMPELSNDHDLLVRLDVKLDLVSVQLNEARQLVAAKADREPLELRLAKIEGTQDRLQSKQDWATNKIYMILGGLFVLQVVLKFIKFP